MKKIYSLIALCLFFLLIACETDNKKYYATDFTDPLITHPVPGAQIILSESHQKDSLTIAWKAADFGFPAAAIYTVQIALPGTYFEPAIKIAETKSTSVKVDYATLNNSALLAGLVPETPANVELRIVSTINSHIRILYSEPIPLILTPYNVAVEYPVLYVPGSYQGWNANENTPAITSPRANQVYEGYFWFPANVEFKLLGQPAWGDLEWGSGGDGKLAFKVQPNVALHNTTAGYYKLTADLNNLTYSAVPVSWSITGAATSSNSLNLTYNEDTGLLQLTTQLSAGGFVFQENGAGNRTLGVYFGNQLMDNGSEVIVPATGRYTVSLDLSRYPYTYTLK